MIIEPLLSRSLCLLLDLLCVLLRLLGTGLLIGSKVKDPRREGFGDPLTGVDDVKAQEDALDMDCLSNLCMTVMSSTTVISLYPGGGTLISQLFSLAFELKLDERCLRPKWSCFLFG